MSGHANGQGAAFARAMGPIAREIMGDPNPRLSSKTELRFGTNGSLSVDLVKGVWYDNEAKTGGGVLEFLRIRHGLVNGAALEHLRERDLLPDNPRPQVGATPRTVATYSYTDSDGELLFEVIRKEPKGFLQRRPNGKGGWIWKLGDAKRVPYRLPELLEAIGNGEPIYMARASERYGVLS